MIRLPLLTRPGCHLCDDMKALIHRTDECHRMRLEEVDISSNAELVRQFGSEIPVLMRDGQVVARTHATKDELLALLRGTETE